MTTGTWNESVESSWHELPYTSWHEWTEDAVAVAQPLTLEFAALAKELIDEFIEVPNAVWVSTSENPAADSNSPFVVTRPTTTEHQVKILFVRDQLEDRQLLQYLKKTTRVTGQVNGLMLPYTGFTPTLKDTVRFNGKTLDVKAIDPVQPIDQPIIYFLEFGS